MKFSDLTREAAEAAGRGDSEAFQEAYRRIQGAFDSLTSKDVCTLTGVQERTLRAWQLRGVLRLATDTKTGKWRRYSFADVLSVALMKRMTEAGFSAHNAADAINNDRHRWANPFGRFYLILQRGVARNKDDRREGEICPDVMLYGTDDVKAVWSCKDHEEPAIVTVIAVHVVAARVFKELAHVIPEREV